MPDLTHIAEGLRGLAVRIDELVPDPRNAREHNDKNMAAVIASLKTFGQRQAVVVQKDGMIVRAGNARLAAATSLGWTHIAALVVDEPELEASAYGIADNRTAELATWNEQQLAELMSEIDDAAPELGDATGFSDQDMMDLMNELDGTEEDGDDDFEPPEATAKPTAKLGQTWLLGEHRLTCGDSTDEETVKRAMGNELAELVFTDPPYGVNVKGSKNKNEQLIAGDLTQTAIPFSFELAVTVAAAEKARFYFCGGEPNFLLYWKLFERYLGQIPRTLVWVKNGFALKPNGYHNQYELVFYGYKKGGGSVWFSGRTEHEASDVWHVDRDGNNERVHPTQKPIELPSRAIRNSCQPGGIVYEPFSGSGSTLIACERLGRRCRAIELDPLYVDAAITRWENITGRKAKLEVEPPKKRSAKKKKAKKKAKAATS